MDTMLDRLHGSAEGLSLDPYADKLDFDAPSTKVQFGLMFPTYEDYNMFIGGWQQRMSEIWDECGDIDYFDWETCCTDKITHNNRELAFILALDELQVNYDYDEELDEFHLAKDKHYDTGIRAFWDTICSNNHMCEAVCLYYDGDEHDIFYYYFGLHKGLAAPDLQFRNTLYPFYDENRYIWGFKGERFSFY